MPKENERRSSVAIWNVWTNTTSQNWNAAGRRSALRTGAAEFGYTYRVDGLLSNLTAFGGTYTYGHGDNGMLTSRVNPWRSVTVNSVKSRPLPETFEMVSDILARNEPKITTS